MAPSVHPTLSVRAIVMDRPNSPGACHGWRIITSSAGTSREVCDATGDLFFVQIHCLTCGARTVRLCKKCVATLMATKDYKNWCGYHALDVAEHHICHSMNFFDVDPALVDISEIGWITKHMEWTNSGHVLSVHYDAAPVCSYSIVSGMVGSVRTVHSDHVCCMEQGSLQRLTVICHQCGPREFSVCSDHAYLVLEPLRAPDASYPLYCSNTNGEHRITEAWK